MSKLQSALRLAAHGFKVFPVVPGGKTPLFEGWQGIATTDATAIRALWFDDIMEVEQPWNIGVSTTGLLVVDVDNKDGKDGDSAIFQLEIEGKYLPGTFEQLTPTGGRHLFYRTAVDIRNSSCRVADGVDVRGCGGLVVGAGSEVPGGLYTANWEEIVEAPEWLVHECSRRTDTVSYAAPTEMVHVDTRYAEQRATRYLQADAPIATEGMGGNHAAYTVAAFLKDLGVDALTAFDLMLDHWNDRCSPPWSPEELSKIVDNAYRYSRGQTGSAAPESEFSVLPKEEPPPPPKELASPVGEFNKRHAFVIAGNGHHILWETRDSKGDFELKHLNEISFHRMYAGRTMNIGNGETEAISKVWMASHERRSYDGFCFRPGLPTPPGFYNLFHGFAVKPAGIKAAIAPEAKLALDRFFEHLHQNVCRGETSLYDWLMGYFAHLFQRPWEKPHTALVFRGRKGVGKNAIVDHVGHLLGVHALVVANSRYLLSNFNSHLERCLLITLDEAFWSGNKDAESSLKHLVTGKEHNIERKGQESYRVDNLTRVVIIGNEEWLVPASEDERRYSVFDVSDARKQDVAFFRSIKDGMDRGGYEQLLRFFLDYDIKAIDVNTAPRTQGLLEQKLKSLAPFHRWWFECLDGGEIIGLEFPGPWPTSMAKEAFRDAFRRYLRENGMSRVRVPEERAVGRYLRDCLPSIRSDGKATEDGRKVNTYQLPPLSQSREEFENFIGHPVDWEKS